MRPDKPKLTASINPSRKPKNLYQNDIKKPAINSVPLTRRSGGAMDVMRSASIKHFAPAIINKISKLSSDIKHVRHPLAAKVDQKIKSISDMKLKTAQPKSMKEIKEAAIAEAMSKTNTDTAKKRFSFFDKKHKFINIFSIGLLLIVAAGIVVYFYIPSLSVKIAASQAGMNATFPSYCPDGYSVDGPVGFGDGEVVINFKSNTNGSKFTIKQTKSSWDSSAVRSKVSKDSGGEFITTEEKGLTIFTHKGNAAWVNGGVLYTINGDAPLPSDRIRRIANSL